MPEHKKPVMDERVREESARILAKNFRMAVLLLAPGMMWLMGTLRQQTFSPWVYAVLEIILLGACLLGGALAQEMTRRSGRNADAQLQKAEESDEE